VADERAGLHARYEARAAADARQPTQRAYHPERPGPRGAPALLRERAREGGGGGARKGPCLPPKHCATHWQGRPKSWATG
jgi:hypothetical protein